MRALLIPVAVLLVSSSAAADIGPPSPSRQGDDKCTVQRICPAGLRCRVLHYQVNPACAARAKAQGMVRRCISGGRNGGSAVFCPFPGAQSKSAPWAPPFSAAAPPRTVPSATARHDAPPPSAAPVQREAPPPAATVPPASTSHGCAGCAMSSRGTPLGAFLLAGVCALFALRRRV